MSFKKLHYYRRSIGLFLNKLLGREYIENSSTITIEVSGLCNLNCVFCAYKDKEDGKQIMPFDAFTDHINQLVDLGIDHIGLTPQTGDVFIDKNFHEKIQFLENHKGIKAFEFITNLISASKEALDNVAKSKKLLGMYISIYGRDSETFQKVTRRPALQYNRLVDNLNYVAEIGSDFLPLLGSFSMAERGFKWSPSDPAHVDDSDVMKALRNLNNKLPRFEWTGNHVDLDSWGGKITQQEMDELEMGYEIVGAKFPMDGPCGMLFGSSIILADGKVNACSCRAVDKSLIIGDTKTSPLHEILSPDNPAYVEILRLHKKGDYPDACKGCKLFTNIYRRPHGRDTVSVNEFLTARRARCDQQKNKINR